MNGQHANCASLASKEMYKKFDTSTQGWIIVLASEAIALGLPRVLRGSQRVAKKRFRQVVVQKPFLVARPFFWSPDSRSEKIFGTKFFLRY